MKPRKRTVIQFFTWVAIFCLTHSLKMRSNSAPDCSGSKVTPEDRVRMMKYMNSEVKIELGLNSHILFTSYETLITLLMLLTSISSS